MKKCTNVKASRLKIKWNHSSEVLSEINKSHDLFKKRVKSIIDRNLSKEDYESEFIICVNKYLAKVARSGQVTDLKGCKYVFDMIRYMRTFHSIECKCMKCRFNAENSIYNSRFINL